MTDEKTGIIISIKNKNNLLSETLKKIHDLSGVELITLETQTHPDIIVLKSKDKLKIGVDSVSAMLKQVKYKPYVLPVKIVVILDAERLTNESQNKLLKVIEEPPKNTYFIISTQNHHRLLDTVVSRCKLYTENSDKDLSSDIDINQLLKMPFYQQCKIIDEIAKINDVQDKRQKVNNLLDNLVHYFRNQWIKDTRTKFCLENIKLIEYSKSAIDRNANLKLALEAMLVNLK